MTCAVCGRVVLSQRCDGPSDPYLPFVCRLRCHRAARTRHGADAMTFMHKLACRLSLMKDRAAFWPTAVLAAGVALGCERPVGITGTGSQLTQFLVAPQVV